MRPAAVWGIVTGPDAFVPKEAFAIAGIDPQRRGETLSVAEFVALTGAVADAPPEPR